MFGVGLQEMAVIAFIAVLVFGPERLPEFARQAAQMIKRVRSLADSARDELRSELGDDYADLELRDLDPRVIVRKHIMEAIESDEDTTPSAAPPTELMAGAIPPFDPEST